MEFGKKIWISNICIIKKHLEFFRIC